MTTKTRVATRSGSAGGTVTGMNDITITIEGSRRHADEVTGKEVTMEGGTLAGLDSLQGLRLEDAMTDLANAAAVVFINRVFIVNFLPFSCFRWV